MRRVCSVIGRLAEIEKLSPISSKVGYKVLRTSFNNFIFLLFFKVQNEIVLLLPLTHDATPRKSADRQQWFV